MDFTVEWDHGRSIVAGLCGNSAETFEGPSILEPWRSKAIIFETFFIFFQGKFINFNFLARFKAFVLGAPCSLGRRCTPLSAWILCQSWSALYRQLTSAPPSNLWAHVLNGVDFNVFSIFRKFWSCSIGRSWSWSLTMRCVEYWSTTSFQGFAFFVLYKKWLKIC